MLLHDFRKVRGSPELTINDRRRKAFSQSLTESRSRARTLDSSALLVSYCRYPEI